MWLSERSNIPEVVVDPDELDLCANADYYRDRRYPRKPWQKALRSTLLQILAYIFSVGILGSILRLIVDVLSSDPNVLRTLRQWQVSSPAVTALTIILVSVLAVVLLRQMFRLHKWLRNDEERERRALARAKTGAELAEHYNNYLERMQRLGPVAPIMATFGAADAASSAALFVGLQLRRVPLTSIGGSVLDRRDASSEGALSTSSPSKNQLPSDGAQEDRTSDHSTAAQVVDNLREALEQPSGGSIVLLGDPGTGKTTLLKQLAREHANTEQQRSQPGGRIPIYFTLSDPQVARSPISDAVDGIIRSGSGSLMPESIAKRIRKEILRGPSLFIVDGLDEVAGDARGLAMKHLNELRRTPLYPPPTHSAASPSNGSAAASKVLGEDNANAEQVARVPLQIVVASRFTSYHAGDLDPTLFVTWQVLPLSREESQAALVSKLLAVLPVSPGKVQLRSSEAPRLLKELNSSAETAGWATHPLLLTLATLVWWSHEGQSVARTRTQLYRQAIDALMIQRMREWRDAERVSALVLAQHVALRMFVQGKREISMQDFLESVQPQLPNGLGTNSPWERLHLSPSDVLFVQSSLFVLRADDRYDIFHLTFLEFLAAEMLARHFDQQWPQQVDRTTLVEAMRSYQERGEDHGAEVTIRTNVLAFVWARHRVPRWHLVLEYVTGILSEVQSSALGAVGRPDLAATWVWALHALSDDDVGLVRLQLAAKCVGACDGTDNRVREIAHFTAHRLTDELVACDRKGQQDRLEELANASGEQAQSIVGREEITHALRSLLRDPTWGTRRVGAFAAGKLRWNGGAVMNDLLSLLADPSPTVRSTASEALGQLGILLSNLPQLLQAQLKVDDWRVREAAADAVGRLGQAGTRALPDLINLLRDPSWRVRWAAIRAVGRIGSEGADVSQILLKQLADEDDSIRTAAASAIESVARGGRLSESDQADLVKALSSSDILESPIGSIRVAALLALAAFKGAARPLFPRVLASLDDPISDVREAALEVITALASSGVPVHQELAEVINDPRRSLETQIMAAETLAECSSEGASVESVLPKLLEDERWQIRAYAADAARHGGMGASSLVPGLQKLLQHDENIDVRAAAAAALVVLDMPSRLSLVDMVSRVVMPPDRQIRLAALRIMRALEEACRDAMPTLRQIFVDQNTDPEVRGVAAWTMLNAGIEAQEAVLDLTMACDDEHLEVRFAALQVVARIIAAQAPDPSTLHASADDGQMEEVLKNLKAAERLGNDCMGVLPLVDKAVMRSGEHRDTLDVVAAAAALLDIIRPVTRLLEALDTANWVPDSPAEAKTHEAASLLRKVRSRVKGSWRSLLASRSPRVRRLAADVAANLGSEAVTVQDELYLLLTDREYEVGEQAAEAMGTLDGAGVSLLHRIPELLGDARWYVRAHAIQALRARGAADPDTLHRLHELLLTEPDRSVQLEAIQALSQLGPAVGPLRDAVLGRLKDVDDRVRSYTLAGLAARTDYDQLMVAGMRQCLSDPERAVQLQAVQGLGKIGVDASLIFPVLEECLAAPDSEVRAAAVSVLATLGAASTEAAQHWTSALSDDDATVRHTAAYSLRSIGIEDDGVRDALLDALADPDPDVWEDAARALAVRAPDTLRKRLPDILAAILTGRGDGLFLSFAQRRELGVYFDVAKAEQEVLSRLQDLLHAQHWSVRQHAVAVLSWSNHPSRSVLQAISDLRGTDRSPAVRRISDDVLSWLLTKQANALEQTYRG